MQLEGMVFALNVMFRGSVHVELDELVVGASVAGGAVDRHLDSGAQVGKDSLCTLGNIELGLLSQYLKGLVCQKVSKMKVEW